MSGDIDMETWKTLDIKTKIAYVTAIIAFVAGWSLTVAGFIVPPLGAVSDSVLWILGQALIYAASVFGVGLYVTGSVKTMQTSLRQFMRQEKQLIEAELEEATEVPQDDE